jgi:hypothetical protein
LFARFDDNDLQLADEQRDYTIGQQRQHRLHTSYNVESDTATLDGSKENLAVWIRLETFQFSIGRLTIKVTIETRQSIPRS